MITTTNSQNISKRNDSASQTAVVDKQTSEIARSKGETRFNGLARVQFMKVASVGKLSYFYSRAELS